MKTEAKDMGLIWSALRAKIKELEDQQAAYMAQHQCRRSKAYDTLIDSYAEIAKRVLEDSAQYKGNVICPKCKEREAYRPALVCDVCRIRAGWLLARAEKR